MRSHTRRTALDRDDADELAQWQAFGIDVNARNHARESALHLAVRSGRIRAVCVCFVCM
jgi:hypothetical protein